MIALLARVDPMATSFSFSIITVLHRVSESSLARLQPMIPAPMMATSYIKVVSPFKKGGKGVCIFTVFNITKTAGHFNTKVIKKLLTRF